MAERIVARKIVNTDFYYNNIIKIVIYITIKIGADDILFFYLIIIIIKEQLRPLMVWC